MGRFARRSKMNEKRRKAIEFEGEITAINLFFR